MQKIILNLFSICLFLFSTTLSADQKQQSATTAESINNSIKDVVAEAIGTKVKESGINNESKKTDEGDDEPGCD